VHPLQLQVNRNLWASNTGAKAAAQALHLNYNNRPNHLLANRSDINPQAAMSLDTT
jgi:hypothetical protein